MTNGKHQIAPPTCILSIILTEVFVHGFSECSRRHPLSDLNFLFIHFGLDLLGLLIFLLTFDLHLKILYYDMLHFFSLKTLFVQTKELYCCVFVNEHHQEEETHMFEGELPVRLAGEERVGAPGTAE